MTTAAPLPSYKPIWIERAAVSLTIGVLCLLTFTLPGRVAPESAGGLDPIGLAKLGSRVGVIAFFTLAWRWNPDRLGRQAVVSLLWPLLAFIAWALLSVAWSPLKTVTLGQALGLTALVSFAAWVALVFRTEYEIGQLLTRIWLAAFLWCVMLLTVNAIDPGLSGLDRLQELRGSNGMVKPTDAGATAGIGLILTLVGPKLVKTFRPGVWFLPSVGAFVLLLLLSQSRTSFGITLVLGTFATLRFFDMRSHAKMLIAVACVCVAYVAIDPGFNLAGKGLDRGAEYLARGQTQTQLTKVSGRAEMWSAVWNEFLRSPWIGHGYFVTSETGRLNVWEGPANHTAHNVVLQVLASTGAIGAALLGIALLNLGSRFYSLRFGESLPRRVLGMASLLWIWYAIWSQTCISFLGAIRVESVIFFTLLGIVTGQAVEQEVRHRAAREGLA